MSTVAVTANTKDKPQSKVWSHKGKHWTVLSTESGINLYRLDGNTWTSVLQLATSDYGKADCKVVGDVTHILVFKGTSSRLFSVEYDSVRNTYKPWRLNPKRVSIDLDKSVETSTIDIDGNGRMWLASDAYEDELGKINVRWSDSPYTTWSAPVTLETGINKDDLCGIIAMPGAGQVGVFWSNQNTKRFGFRTHTDGDSPLTWAPDEVPASQSALYVAGGGMADDHLNLALGKDGTLYCAVKTSYDKAGYPRLALLIRRPTGAWDNLYEISETGTRPIVILNEANQRMKIIYSSVENGGDILYRESPMANISFTHPMLLIGGVYNYATSAKENYKSETVILASTETEVVGVLGIDKPLPAPPAAPVLISPANNASGQPVQVLLSWQQASTVTAYRVQLASDPSFTATIYDERGVSGNSLKVSGLLYNTTYYWRVRAENQGGLSSWSLTRSFSTALSSPTATLAAYWKADEGQGLTLSDASDYTNHALLNGSSLWTTGMNGLALQLSGTGQFATAPSRASLEIRNAITLAAWVKPARSGSSQVLIKKGLSGQTDGYELAITSTDKVFFRINQLSEADNFRLNSLATIPTDGNTWVHLAATYDGTTIKLYVNGVLDRSKVLTPMLINQNTLPVALGAQSNGTSAFKGALDEIRIYNTALSASEISQLASANASARLAGTGTQQQLLLNAYPNPFSDNASVNFVATENGSYTLALYNLYGKQINILKEGTTLAGQQVSAEISGKHLQKGLYIIRLQTTREVKTLNLLLDK
ncbi:LamG-like jellyroll fold domain-containing protein [Adhaeribacter soli]|uniref:LamG-like jellyroll fold domain-containing protein n=1 Tax=Adhaeribacter soli TaxID=2607655 RepID=UPI00177BCEAE|nr:LamG-like jellyroll fold domain-containing protein [Adhaeribacter soli]